MVPWELSTKKLMTWHFLVLFFAIISLELRSSLLQQANAFFCDRQYYRQLNKQVHLDRFPIPLIQDVLDSLSDTMYFSTLDLRSGFWQIPLAKSARQLLTPRCGGAQVQRAAVGRSRPQ